MLISSKQQELCLANDRDLILINEALEKIFNSTPTTLGAIYGVGFSGDTSLSIEEKHGESAAIKREYIFNGLKIRGIFPDSEFTWEIKPKEYSEKNEVGGICGSMIEDAHAGIATEINCRANEIMISFKSEGFLREVTIRPAPDAKIRIGLYPINS